jgi:hypothetical protein
MSIENMDAYLKSLVDWKILDGCFGQTRIKPTDVDGLVERRGHCLFLERKLPGAVLKQGQRRTFDALAKQGNTTIVFWATGYGEGVQKMLLITPTDPGRVVDASLSDLRTEVAGWFARCDLEAMEAA